MTYLGTAARALLATATALLFALDAAGQLPEPSATAGTSLHVTAGFPDFSAAGAGLHFRASKFILAETDLSYARVTLSVLDQATRTPVPHGERVGRLSWSFGLLAAYPAVRITPYVGVTAGVVGVRSLAGEEPFLRTRVAIPLGLGYELPHGSTARSEIRLRFTNGTEGTRGLPAELRFGAGWRF